MFTKKVQKFTFNLPELQFFSSSYLMKKNRFNYIQYMVIVSAISPTEMFKTKTLLFILFSEIFQNLKPNSKNSYSQSSFPQFQF